MKKQKHGSRQKQSGIAIVEATMVLPILFLLFFTICEFGYAFYTYNTLNKAMQNGARFLASNALFSPTDAIELDYTEPTGSAYQASNLIVYGNIGGQSKKVLVGLKPGDINFSVPQPGFIKVDINYQYIPLIGPVFHTFGFGESIDLNFTLNSSVTLRAI